MFNQFGWSIGVKSESKILYIKKSLFFYALFRGQWQLIAKISGGATSENC